MTYQYECICAPAVDYWHLHNQTCLIWNKRKAAEYAETGIERHWREEEEKCQKQ